jgi:hypothetical protein
MMSSHWIVVLFVLSTTSRVVFSADPGSGPVRSSESLPELSNADFKAGTKDWELAAIGAKPAIGVDREIVHGGKQSLRISSNQPTDTALGQEIRLAPERAYKLSAWVRTQGLDPGNGKASGTIQVQMPEGKGIIAGGESHRGDSNWTEVEVRFQAPSDGRVRICLFFIGWGRGTGTAWFDDLKLEVIEPFRNAPKKFALLIVSPKEFVETLKPFVAYKTGSGMPAYLVTLEDIVAGSFPGCDHPERIKRAIAEAQRSHDVKYVMLAGDAGHIPVRYWFGSSDTKLGFGHLPTDYYYANLYHHHVAGQGSALKITHKYEFDTWDKNKNGRFNEQYGSKSVTDNPDDVDAYPDVAVGRVPAANRVELARYLNKVMSYEKGKRRAAGAPRFTVFSDASEDSPSPLELSDKLTGPDGLKVNGAVVEKFGFGREPSDPPLGDKWKPGDFASIREATEKSFWISYSGHGTAMAWCVPGREGWFDDGQVSKLDNNGDLPIVVASACSTGRFAPETPLEPYRDKDGKVRKYEMRAGDGSWNDTWDVTEPDKPQACPLPLTPVEPNVYADVDNRCLAAVWLFSSDKAGAIAYIGNPRVAQAQALSVEVGMLQGYSQGMKVLGDVWLHGQRVYWVSHRTDEDYFNANRAALLDPHLFGDPSLRLNDAGGR